MFAKLAAAVLIVTLGWGTARAEEPEKLALAVPTEVTEVATAGTWGAGDLSGVFRAVVLTVPAGDATQAHLVIQLMAVSADGTTQRVHKTVLVPQISAKKFPIAFVAVEDDATENEVTWRVTSYDANANTDLGSLVTINAGGGLTVKDAPKEDAPAAPDKK